MICPYTALKGKQAAEPAPILPNLFRYGWDLLDGKICLQLMIESPIPDEKHGRASSIWNLLTLLKHLLTLPHNQNKYINPRGLSQDSTRNCIILALGRARSRPQASLGLSQVCHYKKLHGFWLLAEPLGLSQICNYKKLHNLGSWQSAV